MAQNILTADGFKRKRYADFVLELEEKARDLFGNDINLSSQGPMGKFIQIIAYEMAEDNELSEAVYLSGNIETAEGVALDYAVKRGSGISRIPAGPSSGSLSLNCTPGMSVPLGIIVATVTGVEFVTTSSAVDEDSDGSVTVSAEAVLPGVLGNVPAGTVTVLKTAIAGVSSVTNPEPMTGGRERETDVQLRSRHFQSLSYGGRATVDAIRAALLQVPNVREAYVVENDSDTEDPEGRPPHCFESYVIGGEATDIGSAILASKPGGIRAYGSEVVVVKDSAGRDKTIGFTYTPPVEIYVNVTVTRNPSFPSDGEELVVQTIVEFIGGEDAQGQYHPGIGVGRSVIHSILVGTVTSGVPGIADVIITLRKGTDGSFSSSNITIGETEVAETSYDKVVVTLV